MNFFYKILLHIFNVFYPSKIYGKENVPEGKAIFVCNHFWAMDPALLLNVCSKKMHFLAKKELFEKKFASRFLRSLGAFPIDRGTNDLKSLFTTFRILKNGEKLVIFPEGTRNKSGTDDLQEIKSGSALISVKTKSPIVPIMILKKARFLRRTKIIVGKPFEFSEYYDKNLSTQTLEEMDAKLRNKMIDLHNELKTKVNKKYANNQR